LWIFITLKIPSPWLGLKPATFASSGKHTNLYTIKDTAQQLIGITTEILLLVHTILPI
jgi:hypothetical protein